MGPGDDARGGSGRRDPGRGSSGEPDKGRAVSVRIHEEVREGQSALPRHHGRARRIRFVIWTVLLVALVGVVGALASPAKTAKRRHSTPAVSTTVPANPGRNTVLHHGGCHSDPGRYGRGI